MITVPLDGGAHTFGVFYPAATGEPGARLVLAHGAGAGQQHPFMTGMATALATHGVEVFTFNFPYAEQGRHLPDRTPVLEACFRCAIDVARALPGPGARALFIGGKSMGGRMATRLAAEGVEGLRGVVALGYPLHPPGRPDQLRTAHLAAITVPTLIVQGERDVFGTPPELAPHVEAMSAPVTVHPVSGADHALAVKGRAAADGYEATASLVAAWMVALLEPA